MERILETERSIPVAGETDVVVVGGGIAGIAAAVAARRNGARVVLIEKSIVLGGLATLGHVCVYLALDDGAGNKVYGGLAEELLKTCIRYGYDTLPECWRDGPDTVRDPKGRYVTVFNIPAAVMAFDELMAQEGVEVVFDTAFCAPIMEGDTCRGVIVENKSGRSAYLAKVFVDASGDADLLFRAGAACETQKNCVYYWCHELDLAKLRDGTGDRSLLQCMPMRPFDSESDDSAPMFDGTTSEGVNGFIRLSRSYALDHLEKNQRPDYAMVTMPYMADFIMTRRLRGMAELILEPGRHEDHSVGCMIYSLDAPAAVYEFPYEALICENIANILAAGRLVSATGLAWEVSRYIPACALSGEAAGTAAAIAAAEGCTLQELDVSALQSRLASAGVKVHMTEAMRHNGGKIHVSDTKHGA